MSVFEHFICNPNCFVCWPSLLCGHTERTDVKCAFEKRILKSQFQKHNI
jgi:hypothetical protein